MFRVWIIASAIWVGYCAWHFWASCELEVSAHEVELGTGSNLRRTRRLTMYLVALDCATLNPSLTPTGGPHSFSMCAVTSV
jgi:hypothetical protein